MSYGGQSNAPWQRNAMQGHPQSDGFHQGSQMFMQNNMAPFGHGGIQDGGNTFLGVGGNSVAYPQPRSGLNPVAFQPNVGGQSHYNSIGTVTKMNGDCGLVNDEVFFYRNVCKGPEPKLGDRVIFEATYSNNGQFKWNATRIQLMQQAQHVMSSNKGSYGVPIAPTNDYQRGGPLRRSSPKRSPVRGRHERDARERGRLHRSRDRDEDEHERKRRREDRSRDRAAPISRGSGHAAARNEKERGRADSRKKEREVPDWEREEREKEHARELELERVGDKGRRARRVKRYMVEIPKALLSIKTADIQDLRKRYNSLYIPSDFFFANIKWSDSFTFENPFSLRRPCQFHIMHETVENPNEQDPDLLEPADANYLYTAKVMLMSLPPIAEIYKKCFENDDDPDHHAVHPSRLINFLVGVKGRVGSMAIGGPWSPSLDGENPDKDPSVLIRTAIRTCKALTGIDLSNCTQWYRFVELYYHRTEYKNMEKDGPPRVETVVIYLPDVHSLMPSIEEWQTLTQVYRNAADEVIARRKTLVTTANANDDKEKFQDAEMADSSLHSNDEAAEGHNDAEEEQDAPPEEADNEANPATASADAQDNDEANEVVAIDDDDEEEEEEEEEKLDNSTASADVSGATATEDLDAEATGAETEQPDDEEMAEEENDEPAPEPTHYSLLDLKTMKVQEMRDELLARNLPEKGVRNVIMARLAKALNTEKAEELQKRKAKKAQQEANKSTKQTDKTDADSEMQKTADKKVHDKKDIKTTTTTKHANNKKYPTKGKKESKDDKEDFSNDIDFEMGDIMILDEYDSSKCNEESNLKEMTEKEKSQLIRHYTLPSTPHIIVHPNRRAKGGKFDCAVVSLSVLLYYHPEDSKERFFEVSLFAELFNDMLMRDFGFTIYKEICLHKRTDAEINELKNETDMKAENTASGEETKKETKETKDDDKERTSKKDTKSSTNSEKSGKEQKNDDTTSIKSESRKRKLSTTASTANSKDHDAPANDKKMIVVKPHLLLAFVYFDTNHCGYIVDKHLEDLFYNLGLNLSRSQIKKVLQNLGIFATTYTIHYRKLTDKEATLESTPAIEDVDDIPLEQLQLLAAGNNIYETVFGRNKVQNQVSAIGGDDGDSKDGLINFNGTVVNVGKLLHQINRTERNYSDLEKLHNDLLKQHGDLQKDHSKATTKLKELQAEIKSVTRKLTEANQDYYALNRKYRDRNATLSYIYTRVTPYFVREKGDKDKDGKEKEKDKTNDKDKPKEEKEKEVKKEKTNEEQEKEAIKDENEKLKEGKEKPKEEKEKSKEEKEKPKEEKEKPKDEKEKPKEEKEKPKEEKDKPKVEKEKPKEDHKEKEKEKPKEEKVKQPEKPVKVAVKDKQPEKDNKEKAKDNKETTKIENNKPHNIKPKPPATTTTTQVKATPQKTNNAKPATPAAKKLNDNKTPAKVIKKSDNVGTKK